MLDEYRNALSHLQALPGIDEVMAKERAGGVMARSLKTTAKLEALHLLISCMDLTSLEGTDTPASSRGLTRKGMQPSIEETDRSVAAVCVYADRVGAVLEMAKGSSVKAACVAGAFPHGRATLELKDAEIAWALAQGADEIDMVIDRAALLSGEYEVCFMDIYRAKALCRGADAKLKVILETGELGTLENVAKASVLALHAGADFLKTSTGKIPVGATGEAVLVMCNQIRDFHALTGQVCGIKVSGGVKTSKMGLGYLTLVNELLGEDWLRPELFRIGASSLLDDTLLQLRRNRLGNYASVASVTIQQP